MVSSQWVLEEPIFCNPVNTAGAVSLKCSAGSFH
uniref:Uncharacterized protein n=1 Tax=Anguilla anguilla TaxID=7936 RepID=A0A0E9XF00_ANGAN